MSKELKKIYLILLLPSIFGFALACWAKTYDFIEINSINFIEIAGAVDFYFMHRFSDCFSNFLSDLIRPQKSRPDKCI